MAARPLVQAPLLTRCRSRVGSDRCSSSGGLLLLRGGGAARLAGGGAARAGDAAVAPVFAAAGSIGGRRAGSRVGGRRSAVGLPLVSPAAPCCCPAVSWALSPSLPPERRRLQSASPTASGAIQGPPPLTCSSRPCRSARKGCSARLRPRGSRRSPWSRCRAACRRSRSGRSTWGKGRGLPWRAASWSVARELEGENNERERESERD